MWGTDGSKAYPFRHEHPNHFPPLSRTEEDHLSSYSSYLEGYGSHEEVPIVLMIPEKNPKAHKRSFSSPSTLSVNFTQTPIERGQRNTTPSSKRLPELPPITEQFESEYMGAGEGVMTPPVPLRKRPTLNLKPLSIPPRGPLPSIPETPHSAPFPSYYSTAGSNTSTPAMSTPQRSRHLRKDAPPTPSSLAPEKIPNILTEVLTIMNSVLSQQHSIQEDDAILSDLAELVVIMQEEAEGLLHLAHLVEEFTEEVASTKEAAEIEAWVEGMGLDDLPEISDGSSVSTDTDSGVVTPVNGKPAHHGKGSNHSRDYSVDSALGLEDERRGLGHMRDGSGTIHHAALVQIAQLKQTESEIRRGNLVEIGRRALERGEGAAAMPNTPRTPRTPRTPMTPHTPHTPHSAPLVQLVHISRTPHTPQTPRTQYVRQYKPSRGDIKLIDRDPRSGDLRKYAPPSWLLRDPAVAMTPVSSTGFRAKGNVNIISSSPQWI